MVKFTSTFISKMKNAFTQNATNTNVSRTNTVNSQQKKSSIFTELWKPQNNKYLLPETKLPTGAQDASNIKNGEYFFNVDFSKLQDGKQYYITGYELQKDDDGREVFQPQTRDIENPTRSKDFNFSEGLDRQITEIRISSSLDKEVQRELIEIGKQKGFTVTVIQNKEKYPWLEDYSNFRPDGSVMIVNEGLNGVGIVSDSRKSITSKIVPQGAVSQSELSSDYQQLISPSDVVKGKTYLEGGNILTTYTKDGKPATIIGEESILTTKAMLKENNPDISDEQVIALVAKDLGVDAKNITVIPQYDFHIDMSYRPLKNGQIAVPDFETAISILETTRLDGVSVKQQEVLLDKLRTAAEKTKVIREETNAKLEQDGYSLVNIPCFSPLYRRTEAEKASAKTNYMNAVCGTAPDGSTYYITNKSDYSALDDIIAKYFKDAGIDDVYFVSTNSYLHNEGGIDCLTKEIAKNVE